MFKADVYDRTGTDSMSRNLFFLVVGCVLTWGFGLTYIVSEMTANWRPGIFEFHIVGLGVPLVGIFVSRHPSAIISFIGFNLVVVPFGAILGPVLAVYELSEPGVVSGVAALTGAVTGVMALSGLLFPKFYRSIGGVLFWALIALLIVLVTSFFIPGIMEFGIIDYLAAGLFALYIGYDMHRASEIPATMNNAVDVCVSLYLDVINLFLWILRIVSGND